MTDVSLKRLFKVWLLGTTLLAAVSVSSAQEREQAEQELSSVTAAIESIQVWLNEAASRQSEEESRLRETGLQLSENQQAYTSLSARVETTQAELGSLQQQLTGLEAQKTEEEELLLTLLRAAHMTSDSSFLKTLLNQEKSGEVARQLHYAQRFSRYQTEQIASFQATLQELESVRQSLTSTLSELNDQQTQLAERSAELEASKLAREQALASLRSSINSRSAEMEQLEISQAELQLLIAEITRAMEGISSFADVPPLADSRGELPRPVTDSVVRSFGSRYGGGSLVRQGMSFAPNPGSPVRAIHPGRVVFADWLRGSGLLVVLDHGGGYMSLYGHNEALAVDSGSWVDVGDVLATSGINSSDADAGLYFEIRRDGEPQDPSAWLD